MRLIGRPQSLGYNPANQTIVRSIKLVPNWVLRLQFWFVAMMVFSSFGLFTETLFGVRIHLGSIPMAFAFAVWFGLPRHSGKGNVWGYSG